MPNRTHEWHISAKTRASKNHVSQSYLAKNIRMTDPLPGLWPGFEKIYP